MNMKKSKRALRKIARKEGVSVDAVRREISLAVDTAQSNPDPKIKAFWANIPRKADKPTPEEVIAYISIIADKKRKGR